MEASKDLLEMIRDALVVLGSSWKGWAAAVVWGVVLARTVPQMGFLLLLLIAAFLGNATGAAIDNFLWSKSRSQRAEGVLDQIRYLWEQSLELRLPEGRALRARLFRTYSRLLSSAATPESAQHDVDEVQEDLAVEQAELHLALRQGEISDAEHHAIKEEARAQGGRINSLVANAGWSSGRDAPARREPLAITTGRKKQTVGDDSIEVRPTKDRLPAAKATSRPTSARRRRPLL